MKLLSLEPESSASANSAMPAYSAVKHRFTQRFILYHPACCLSIPFFIFLKKYVCGKLAGANAVGIAPGAGWKDCRSAQSCREGILS